MTSARVFLLDDDPVQLVFIGGVLRSARYVIETFAQPDALLARISPKDRGCMVLDWKMPGQNGLQLHAVLLGRGVLLPVIFASGSADIPVAVEAMRQGAVHFLTKPVDAAALLEMVAHAMQKDAAAAADRTMRTELRLKWATLALREQDVCRLCAQGMLIKQVGAALGLTDSTVQAHRSKALAKLGVANVADLIKLLTLLERVSTENQR